MAVDNNVTGEKKFFLQISFIHIIHKCELKKIKKILYGSLEYSILKLKDVCY